MNPLEARIIEQEEQEYITQRILESLEENGIKEPTVGLLKALEVTEKMRLTIQKEFRSWLPPQQEQFLQVNEVREKTVRNKNDTAKKYAKSLSFVIRGENPHVKIGRDYNVETIVMFRFPMPNKVTVEITAHHEIFSCTLHRCRPQQYFTEHMTASFNHAEVFRDIYNDSNDRYESRTMESGLLEMRAKMNIKALIQQSLLTVWT